MWGPQCGDAMDGGGKPVTTDSRTHVVTSVERGVLHALVRQ